MTVTPNGLSCASSAAGSACIDPNGSSSASGSATTAGEKEASKGDAVSPSGSTELNTGAGGCDAGIVPAPVFIDNLGVPADAGAAPLLAVMSRPPSSGSS